MSKYSELAERLVKLPTGKMTVRTVQTIVEAAAALRELEAEVERKRFLLARAYSALDLWEPDPKPARNAIRPALEQFNG